MLFRSVRRLQSKENVVVVVPSVVARISEMGEVFLQYVNGGLGRDCACRVYAWVLEYASTSTRQLEPMKLIAWSK